VAVRLSRVGIEKAEYIWKMQVEAFSGLYEKYKDTDTSPATETIERVRQRLEQSATFYYLIECDSSIAGAIRVVDRGDCVAPKRISPIFVLDEYRGRGIAQAAINEAERIHGDSNWELDTILEETGNCYLYEKLGYRKTGKTEKVNDKMTLVFYIKN